MLGRTFIRKLPEFFKDEDVKDAIKILADSFIKKTTKK